MSMGFIAEIGADGSCIGFELIAELAKRDSELGSPWSLVGSGNSKWVSQQLTPEDTVVLTITELCQREVKMISLANHESWLLR